MTEKNKKVKSRKEITDPATIKELLKSSEKGAFRALEAIEALKDNKIFADALINCLAHPVWIVRKKAAQILFNTDFSILDKLIDAMDSSNEDRSFWAIKILSNYGEKAVLPLSKSYNKKVNIDKRFFIVAALGNCNSINAIPSLINALTDTSWSVRKEASDQLVKMNQKAIPELHKAVQSTNSNLKYWAIKTMARILGIDVIEPMKKVLTGSDSKMRYYAVLALGEIENSKSTALLINALGDSSWIVRKLAADQLYKSGKRVIPDLVKAFDDGTPDIKYWAIQLIGKIMKAKAIEPLKKFISDPDENLRSYAVLALGETRSDKAIPYLIDRFSDPSWLVREQSADVIIKHGKKALPYLEKALNNDSEDIRFWAIRVLAKLSDNGFSILEKNITWMDSKTRLFILDNLIEYSLDDSRDLLISSLGDSHWPVRNRAYSGLIEYGKKIIPYLLKYIDSSDNDLRYWTNKILNHYSRDFSNYLITQFNKENIEVSDRILKTLREISNEKLVIDLIGQTEKLNEKGRYYLIKLLSRTHKQAFDVLKNMLLTAKPDIQIIIIKAFGNHPIALEMTNITSIKTLNPKIQEAITETIVKKDSTGFIKHLMKRFIHGTEKEQSVIAKEFEKTLPQFFLQSLEDIAERINGETSRQYAIQILTAFIENNFSKCADVFEKQNDNALQLSLEAGVRCSAENQKQYFEYILFNWCRDRAITVLDFLKDVEFDWFPKIAFRLIDVKDDLFVKAVLNILSGYNNSLSIIKALENREIPDIVVDWCHNHGLSDFLKTSESHLSKKGDVKSTITVIKPSTEISLDSTENQSDNSSFKGRFQKLFKNNETQEKMVYMKDFNLLGNMAKVLKLKTSQLKHWFDKYGKNHLIKSFILFINKDNIHDLHGKELAETFENLLKNSPKSQDS